MITLRKARTIIKATLAKARDLALKPLSVVVLDAGGHPIAFEREDGSAPGRFELARGKAHGCLMLGLGGQAINARAEAQPYFVQAMNGLYGGKFVPVMGGVLVRDGRGNIVGAVGVTGDTSEHDAVCAAAGIVAAGFTPET